MNKISERIKTIRDTAELTKTAFAKEVGVTQQYISQLEADPPVREPSTLFIKAVAHTFGINEEWLTTGSGEMRPTPTAVVADQWGASTVIENLIRLTIVAQIPLPKTELWMDCIAAYLGVDPQEIKGWVKKNTIPQDVIAAVSRRGIHNGDWCIEMPSLKVTEQKLRRLAGLAGIEIGTLWGDRLAEAIGVPKAEIILALFKDELTTDLIRKIEAAGYPLHKWADAPMQTPHLQNQQYKQLTEDIEELKQRMTAIERTRK